MLLELRADAVSRQLQQLSSRSVNIPGGVFSLAFTADSSFLLILQDSQRRSCIYALHVPLLMRRALRCPDISIRDPAFVLQLCEGFSCAFHSSPRAGDNLVAITCDTDLLLITLICSADSVLSCRHVRRLPGCSGGHAPQIVADAVLFLRPDGLCRLREADGWAGDMEVVGPVGGFSATRDGRYVAVKREGHGVSASAQGFDLQAFGGSIDHWMSAGSFCLVLSFTPAFRLLS